MSMSVSMSVSTGGAGLGDARSNVGRVKVYGGAPPYSSQGPFLPKPRTPSLLGPLSLMGHLAPCSQVQGQRVPGSSGACLGGT